MRLRKGVSRDRRFREHDPLQTTKLQCNRCGCCGETADSETRERESAQRVRSSTVLVVRATTDSEQELAVGVGVDRGDARRP